MAKQALYHTPLLVLGFLCASLQAQTVYTSNPGPGPVDITAAGSILDASGGQITSNAIFTGNGDLTIRGGTVSLQGASTFTGSTFVNSTTSVYSNSAFGNTANSVHLNNTLNFYGNTTIAQTIRVTSNNRRIQPATNNATATLSGNIIFDGNYTLNIGNSFKVANRNVTISGNITDGSHTGGIVVDGDNSLFILSGNNNYSGLTTVSGAGTTLHINGTHATGGFQVSTGTILGGNGVIAFSEGMNIAIAGELDLSGLRFDISSLIPSQSAIVLVDYTGGSLSNTPTDLQSILVNSGNWQVTDTGSLLTATAIPEAGTTTIVSLIASGIVVLLLKRRNGRKAH